MILGSSVKKLKEIEELSIEEDGDELARSDKALLEVPLLDMNVYEQSL